MMNNDAPRIVGEAVLRDYPLRLWARQQEHMDAVLREFQLLLGGHEDGVDDSVPRQLVGLAEFFTSRFGAQITAVNETRQRALDDGLDRIDNRVPLIEGSPELMRQVDEVLEAVDRYCRSGDLLTLGRPPDLLALSKWTLTEIAAQYEGAPPTPWPGPW